LPSLRHQLAAPLLYAATRIRRWASVPARGLDILLFHDIRPHQRDNFERLIVAVKRDGGFVTPQAAEAWLGGSPRTARPPGGSCLLSFDDAFASNFDVAAGILARHDVKALFFVCPGLIELNGAAQKEAVANHVFQGRLPATQLPPDQRLMTWDEIRQLRQDGHRIGCHGLLHRRLTALDNTALREEVIGAADLLDARIGEATPWYAYAFGDIASIDARTLDLIRTRFRFCRSGIRGSNGATTPAAALLAESIDPDTPLTYQKAILAGALDFRYRAARKTLHDLIERA
jgi:peptidoglycan/xylan/chitin deacetylase (PgdA/CDA1 family)